MSAVRGGIKQSIKMGFSQTVNHHKHKMYWSTHTLTNMNKDIRLMGPVTADRCTLRHTHTHTIPTRHTLLLLNGSVWELRTTEENTASLANFKETAAHSLGHQLNSVF